MSKKSLFVQRQHVLDTVQHLRQHWKQPKFVGPLQFVQLIKTKRYIRRRKKVFPSLLALRKRSRIVSLWLREYRKGQS